VTRTASTERKPDRLRLAGLIPDARVEIHSDAAYGFLFQYPADVAKEVNAFLDA
jgi:hypothetical protein